MFVLVYNISEQMDGGFKTLGKSPGQTSWIRLNLKYNNDRGIFRQKNQGTVSLLLVLLCVCVHAVASVVADFFATPWTPTM